MSEMLKMKHKDIVTTRVSVILLLFLLLLSGCVAGETSFLQGNRALESKNYDQAVMEYLHAVNENPKKSAYRLKLNQSRSKASQAHKQAGDRFFAAEQYLDALHEYQLAADLDGSIYSAYEGIRNSQDYLNAEKLVQEARQQLGDERYDRAARTVKEALDLVADYKPALLLQKTIKKNQNTVIDGVELSVASTELINLNFRETKLPDVFDILTKLSGINFILDEKVRNDKTTLFLEQVTFAQALELLLRMNNLDKKVLNSKTIILFPKTRDKQKQFEDQVIQTFYLSHIDAKKVVNMLRSMLQVRKIYVQEELNAIVIRDTPDVIRLAKKMIEATDRGNSEVVFDLELIEVNHNDTRELGLKLSNYLIGAGLSIPDSGTIVNSGLSAGGLTANLTDFNQSLDPFYSIPTASFRFMKTLGDAEILANPKIRVRNGAKAKVHVGSREPVVTVTINDTQTSENVQYIDVGVKLDVEPTIQLDNTIVTKLGLEVSNVSGRETTSNGTAVITISSTNADTTLTLKDGEQTIIGGLIRNDNAVTKNKVPLLGDIPFLGEVFNGTDKTESKREILLSITPHIVKSVRIPQGDVASIYSGGEDDMRFGRNFGTFIDEYNTGQQMERPQTDDIDQSGMVTPETLQPAADQTAGETFSNLHKKTKLGAESTVTETQIIAPQNPPLIFIEGAKTAKVGDLIDVVVRGEKLSSLESILLNLNFDPEMLELVSAQAGTLARQQLPPANFNFTDPESSGHVELEITTQAGLPGISGAGVLSQLKFRALKSGITEITPATMESISAGITSTDAEGFGLLVNIVQ